MSRNPSFDKISSDYLEVSKTENATIYQGVGRSINSAIIGNSVLDVGGGCNLAYDYKKCREFYVVDTSIESLKLLPQGINKIVDDARSLGNLDDKKFDVIIINFVLHHITSLTRSGTYNQFSKVLESSIDRLNPGGKILISEVIVPGWISFLQFVLRPIIFLLGHIFRFDCVYFYTKRELIRNIEKVIGTKTYKISASSIECNGKIDPFSGTFPGVIKIDAKLIPTDYVVLLVEFKS